MIKVLAIIIVAPLIYFISRILTISIGIDDMISFGISLFLSFMMAVIMVEIIDRKMKIKGDKCKENDEKD